MMDATTDIALTVAEQVDEMERKLAFYQRLDLEHMTEIKRLQTIVSNYDKQLADLFIKNDGTEEKLIKVAEERSRLRKMLAILSLFLLIMPMYALLFVR